MLKHAARYVALASSQPFCSVLMEEVKDPEARLLYAPLTRERWLPFSASPARVWGMALCLCLVAFVSAYNSVHIVQFVSTRFFLVTACITLSFTAFHKLRTTGLTPPQQNLLPQHVTVRILLKYCVV